MNLDQELKKITVNLAPSKQAEVEIFFKLYREHIIEEIENTKPGFAEGDKSTRYGFYCAKEEIINLIRGV